MAELTWWTIVPALQVDPQGAEMQCDGYPRRSRFAVARSPSQLLERVWPAAYDR